MNRFTTLGTVLGWFSGFKQKPVKNHRTFLLEQVNDARRLMYGFYEDVQLFENDQECFSVQSFAQDCNDCDPSYLGITLPDYMLSPAAMWINETPIKLFSKWREYKTGIKPSDSCRLENYVESNSAPTERDIAPMGSACKVAFTVESSLDAGKIVILRFKDVGGQIREDSITLVDGGKSCSSSSVVSIPDKGIVLPSDLVGSVTLLQADGKGEGRVLSSYAPHQTVPSFTRMKLTGVCENDVVLVRAARRFVPLYFDTDVVETDNKLAFEHASMYLEHARATNTESITKAQFHVQTCKELLVGEKSRELNKTTIRKMHHTAYRTRQSSLNSKSRTRVWRRY